MYAYSYVRIYLSKYLRIFECIVVSFRDGHKIEATFAKKMDGSTKFCNPNMQRWKFGLNVCNNTIKELQNTFNASRTSVIIAKADSSATANYWRPKNIGCLTNIKLSIGPTVQLPNGESIKATKEGYLNISNELNVKTKNITILPDLKSASY